LTCTQQNWCLKRRVKKRIFLPSCLSNQPALSCLHVRQLLNILWGNEKKKYYKSREK
jgi:hypothetical protein